nr:MAG TPA: hypothetical protein [Bacteriophage sp.]
MTKVRSEYIKKLMSESHSLEEKLKDVAQSTINSILEEKTNKNLRQILSEDENSFSEEEVDDDVELGGSEDTSEEEGAEENDAENSEWDDLEQYKDEDGEYDLRSMDKDELVKVLKVMSPDDAVRIVKNDDDSLTVTDEANDEEFDLELDNDEDEEIDIDVEDNEDDDFDDDGEFVVDIDNDDDEEFEVEDDEENDFDDDDVLEIELDESNLGYTDNYQKKTAMTTPDNHEPANPRSTYSMDGGVPKGTEKPWVGGRKKAPFDDEVNEGCETSIQEGGAFGKAAARVTGKQRRNNSSGQGGQPYGGRHNSVAGEYKDYQESSVSENIKKKANQIFVENKQLKSLMKKLQNQVNEAIVVNQSLANVIKLINENATTVNEKKEILRRFNDCTTKEESNKLYSTISEELKRSGKTHSNVTDTINSQLSESRDRAVETPMYQSQDLSETISFMNRLNAIK